MRYVLYPPNLSSESAQDIKQALLKKERHCFIAKRDGEYQPKSTDLIIGWGYSRCPVWSNKATTADWLNRYNSIPNALNKQRAFFLMEAKSVSLPEFTEETSIANKWLKQGHFVYARTVVTGMRGDGIIVCNPNKHAATPPALLYVKHFPSTREFRVYVFKDKVVDVLEKRKSAKEYKGNDWVRSEENGWVFCRQHVELPSICSKEAVKAIKALNLDFGGVDVLYKYNQAVILEVNTMPGVFGTGAKIFAETFINYHEGK